MDSYQQLREKMLMFMSDYSDVYEAVKKKNDWKNPFREIIGHDIPHLLSSSAGIKEPYTVVGSYGKGRWTAVPWIAIFDTRITTSALKGVYIVYLLNKDLRELYLSFALGATTVIQNSNEKITFTGITGSSSQKNLDKLITEAAKIRNVLGTSRFNNPPGINTGSVNYDAGTIFYTKYTLQEMPSGHQLVQDLKDMLDLYAMYYKKLGDNNAQIEDLKDADEEREMPKTLREKITNIEKYILSKGFSYPEGLIENFYLSLKSKPFVILAGTSGTGKTRLVKLFAEAIGAEYKLVSVRPDWSDGSDLFGHYDLNGKFIEGPVCECFEAAEANPQKPVFLCLDEMNLARVEYYLSDFLSVIESREKQEDGSILTTGIAQYETGIPDNLYIVGTVNMDETTFPFSRKVLDRANTIEFNYVDLMPAFDDALASQEPLKVSNQFLRSEYLILARDCVNESVYVNEICAELQAINEILRKANAHVGYRVRDEIVFYMLENLRDGGILKREEAFDNEIMQKILPRLQGSSASVRDMLCELFRHCAADHSQKTGDTDSEKMRKVLDDDSIACQYRKSAEKLQMMVRRFEDDGFTSYWL